MRTRVLVTGGNRGLGRATAEKLAARGAAVTITSRDLARGERTATEIRAAVPGADVRCLPLDLLDRASIRALAETIAARPEPLDVLLNNAGLLVAQRFRRARSRTMRRRRSACGTCAWSCSVSRTGRRVPRPVRWRPHRASADSTRSPRRCLALPTTIRAARASGMDRHPARRTRAARASPSSAPPPPARKVP